MWTRNRVRRVPADDIRPKESIMSDQRTSHLSTTDTDNDSVERRRLIGVTDALTDELDALVALTPNDECSRSLRAHLNWVVSEAHSLLPNDRYLAFIDQAIT